MLETCSWCLRAGAEMRAICPNRGGGAPCEHREFEGVCWKLWIPGRLPGLNDIVAAAKAGRNRGAMYSEQKRAAESRIEAAIYDAELPRFERVTLAYELVEPPGPQNKDRDIGNVLAGATKYVEDALVRAGVLPTDGPSCIVGYDKTTRRVDPVDGVRVTIRRA